MIETIKQIEITNKNQLIEYFVSGNKPKTEWGIGTEHEKFLCHGDGFGRLAYDSNPGIKQILEHLMSSCWQPILENGNLIGLKKDGASISLEPGGQYELSGKNIKTIHHTYEETKRHFDELKEISAKFNVINLALGFDPLWKREEMNWMPKKRYKFMRAYMPTKGNLGLDMMTRTATIQVNLDYQDEADMIKKMRVAQAIQPIATALFANSPFSEGKPNGYLSYRSHVWDDTDPDRCGFLSFIFDSDFGFERWTDYLLDVPMYFIYRNGDYIPSGNITFRQFMEGKHHLKPLMTDWETHVSTVFPDVRLKQFIEMRGADASCCNHISALSAFWVGLLYDEEALNCVSNYIKGWSIKSMKEIRDQVPKLALNAEYQDLNVKDIARDLIKISSGGLSRRKLALGIEDESKYLEPLVRIAETGKTQAEKLLDAYHNKWNKNICVVLKNHC
jgi:glutamate--cysteine ligase